MHCADWFHCRGESRFARLSKLHIVGEGFHALPFTLDCKNMSGRDGNLPLRFLRRNIIRRKWRLPTLCNGVVIDGA